MSIIYYPEPILSTVSDTVDFKKTSKEELSELYSNLCKYMIQYEGIGIAANQIGISHKACVIYSESNLQNKFIYLINPEIVKSGKDKITINEGCLSFPGVKIEKTRPKIVTVKYQDINGENKEIVFKGIDSVCAQHEIDHLNGITFINDLTTEEKHSIKEKITNVKKHKMK